MNKPIHKPGTGDPSSGVMKALEAIDAKALSYVQLKRAYSALVQATNAVDEEITRRSEATDQLGETVRIQSPNREAGSSDE